MRHETESDRPPFRLGQRHYYSKVTSLGIGLVTTSSSTTHATRLSRLCASQFVTRSKETSSKLFLRFLEALSGRSDAGTESGEPKASHLIRRRAPDRFVSGCAGIV